MTKEIIMTKEKASKYLTDKALKEMKDNIIRDFTEGGFEWTQRGSIITAKQYNPKWNGSNDLNGVSIYTGKVVRFKIEAI